MRAAIRVERLGYRSAGATASARRMTAQRGVGRSSGPEGDGVAAGGQGRGGGRAAERFQQGDGEAVLVAARVGRLAPGLLGRHVAGRPAGHHRLAHRHRHGQAEVGDPHAAVASHQHVVRLEVAVDDASGVRRLQTVGRRQEDLEDLVGGAAARAQPAAQGDPVDALERQEVHPGVRDHLVQGHDVGVVKAGQRPGLGDPDLVAGGRRLVPVGARPELLEGHRAQQLLVVGVVDDAHAAGSEHAPDEESAHAIAGPGRPGGAVSRSGEAQLGRASQVAGIPHHLRHEQAAPVTGRQMALGHAPLGGRQGAGHERSGAGGVQTDHGRRGFVSLGSGRFWHIVSQA